MGNDWDVDSRATPQNSRLSSAPKTPKQPQLGQIKSYSHANCFKMFVRSHSTILFLALPIISKNHCGVLVGSEDVSRPHSNSRASGRYSVGCVTNYGDKRVAAHPSSRKPINNHEISFNVRSIPILLEVVLRPLSKAMM